MFKDSKRNKVSKSKRDEVVQQTAKTIYLEDNREASVIQKKTGSSLHSDSSGEVIQRSGKKKDADKQMAKSLANVKAYSSLANSYDEDDIKEAIAAAGPVKGHHSGKVGDGMNAATKKGLDAIAEHLRASKAGEKAKPAKVHKEAPKVDFEKAMVQATTTYKGDQEKFDEYLKARGYEFSEGQLDDLYEALNK